MKIAENKNSILLQNLGLNQKESSVYLALLELGKGTVSEISRTAQINRTTGYDILNLLVEKGLVSVSGKEPKQEYISENPDKIISFLQKDIEERKNRLNDALKIIPELKSIHNISDRPKVRFYEGREGLEEVYEDTLTATEPIRAYATVDDMHKALPDYFLKYYKRRSGKGIAIRAIIPKTPIGEERGSKDNEEMRKTAFVPPEKYYFSPEINIYDNKVMIASWREKLGIIIESSEIADAMKKIFELSWDRAKELDKELRK